MSSTSLPNTYWTEEKISDLLNHLEQITSKLEEQSTLFQSQNELLEEQSTYFQAQNDLSEYQLTDEYKLEQSELLKQAKKEQEALDQLALERHEEIITSLNGVTEAAGDQTTNTTLIDSFDEFKESYITHRDDLDLFMWVVFATFLFITAFKTLNGQIWRA